MLVVDNQRTLSYSNVSMEGVNAILNQEDASEYLKLGPSGLEVWIMLWLNEYTLSLINSIFSFLRLDVMLVVLKVSAVHSR